MPRPELRAETDALGGIAIMQSAVAVQEYLRDLASMLDARLCVDVGSFTGGSALAMAEGAPAATVLAYERNPEWVALAQHHWRAAGVADRIHCATGDALAALRAVPAHTIDLAFIDADKGAYRDYYEAILPHVRVGGCVVFDDTDWFGMADAPPAHDHEAQAIHALNQWLATDARVAVQRLTLGNGVTICRKRGGQDG